LSVKISSPEGPTTTAVWLPWTIGFGVVLRGRNAIATGNARQLVLVSQEQVLARPVVRPEGSAVAHAVTT